MCDYIVVHSVRVRTEFTPEVFGRLTTLGPPFRLPPNSGSADSVLQVCECVCGQCIIVHIGNLRRGVTRSCGCLRNEVTGKQFRTHGMRRTPEYRSWCHMKERCDNVTCCDYPDYGARGITYCERWKKFENFFADMGRKPSPAHSIGRKNNSGNYEPGNCRWEDGFQQGNNRRGNRIITIGDNADTLANWSRLYGLPAQVVRSRIVKLGWEPLRALTTPTRAMTKNANRDKTA